MFTNYDQYLEKSKILTFERMCALQKEILEEIADDLEAAEIYEELVGTVTKYNEFRTNWLTWGRETRIAKDASRTSCHNSLIVKFNMLARYLKMQGKSVVWRDELGYEENDRY